jgi:hypothetical protein
MRRTATIAVVLVALVGLAGCDAAPVTPDLDSDGFRPEILRAPILGQYPTGNFVPVTFRAPGFNSLVIDITSAGLTIEGVDMPGTVSAGGGGEDVLDMHQDMRLTLSRDRGGKVMVEGRTRARLQSLATEATFDWDARVTGEAFCIKQAGRDAGLDGCPAIQVTQVASGAISGLTGRGSCGTLQQEISYVIILDQDGDTEVARYVIQGFPDAETHGTGTLRVNNQRCAEAVYGVMPGDNIT